MGHWGFQYYMESFGGHPVVVGHPPQQSGDFVVEVGNTLHLLEMRPQVVTSRLVIEIPVNLGVTTSQSELGAGFYSADTGPLPFAVGAVPPERYELLRLGPSTRP
jgi:hypothetical protein